MLQDLLKSCCDYPIMDSDKKTTKADFNLCIHSRDMKTQHIKFRILKERLCLFYCNLVQHNFVLDIFSIGQIFEENFHPFGDVMDDVTKNLDACQGLAFDSFV